MKFSILFFLLLIGCTISKEEWVHPMDDRLPKDENINHRIDLAQNRLAIIEGFFNPKEIKNSININKDAKIEDEFYQQSPKVDVDDKGNSYILHRASSSIHVYDRSGFLKYKIGSGGRGPGEFLRIMTFVINTNNDEMYILGWYKIELFKKENGQFIHYKTIPIEFNRTFDMCKLGNNLFLSGARVGENSIDSSGNIDFSPISKINLETLKIDTTFGFIYRSVTNYPSFNIELSETLLDCNKQTNTVTAFQKHFSFIFGYDEDGTQKWKSKIESNLNVEFIEFKDPKYKNPGMMPHTNSGLYHKKYYPRTLKNTKYALLQMSHIYPQSYFGEPDKISFPEINYRSIIVNTATGELFNSDSYDLIMYMDDSIIITVNKEKENLEYKFIRHEL